MSQFIEIKVVPGARKTEIMGLHGTAVKIRLQAPPVEGKANQALVEFLADTLGLSVREVSLVRGMTSTLKTVSIKGWTREQIQARLLTVRNSGFSRFPKTA
jgi:uncharacterized protein (TIGR00251 family)